MSLFNGIKWPYSTMQQLNLDWILTELKRVMGFFPEDGNAGEVLMKTEEGTEWEPLEAVDLNINALPEDTELTDTDKLVFYDLSASANRKITAPNLLNSMMSDGTPLMDGTASAGTSKKPARYDHRHPTDTSRAPASYFQNNALKISNGGTGATTAMQARLNLDIPVHFYAHPITTNQSLTLNMDAGAGLIICSGQPDTKKLMIIYHVTEDGTVTLRSINPNDNLTTGPATFVPGTNSVTVSNTTTGSLLLWKVVFDTTEISEI